MASLILASSSPIRAELLRRAGVVFHVKPARIDEESLRDSLVADGATPHDIADALAESKVRRVAAQFPHDLVLGCDQVMALEGVVLGKPASLRGAADRLRLLRGKTHLLHSAAVLYDKGRPVWRHVATARLTMRMVSDSFLDIYLERIGPLATATVGAYAVEDVGIRLFSRIEGDYFSILGLPLLELLNALTIRGDIDG